MANVDALRRIGELKIIPVVSIDDAGLAGAMGDALAAGGLPIAEITFRTAAAESSIRALASHKDLLVGAGTVLNIDTAKRAADAGAKFIVSPGFNPKVVRWCIDNRLPITPGTMTPTDIEMALDHGINVVKFFPCEPIGGLKTLKAIAAPYSMIKFVATGGITAENLASYLKFAPILACGGSWMVSKELLAERKFDEVTRLTRAAVEIAQQARPGN
jgi:2-dehydro-3-deoxyphosphogluconate aldolase/(4S)-4-hydroxy-2-oxoglutarate aldolase